MKGIFVTTTIIFLGVTSFALADTVVRTGETVSVSEAQGVAGDLYTAGSIVNVSGKIEGDMLAASGKTTVNGEITGDLLAIGGNVDVHGTVGDDVRVIAGEVVIAEAIEGDVFVVGGAVTILSTATVTGDVLVLGGNVQIDGSVGGDVLGNYGNLRINGPVAGVVNVTTGEFTVGDQAVIDGSVTYRSNTLLHRAPNATITGELVRNDVAVESTRAAVRDWIIPLFILTFGTLVWFMLARPTLNKVVTQTVAYKPLSILYGLIALLLVPLLIIILFVSMLGSLAGAVLLASYLLTVLLAIVALPAVVGHVLLRVFAQPVTGVSFLSVGVGILGVGLISLVPLIGVLALCIILILIFGVIIERIIHFLQT